MSTSKSTSDEKLLTKIQEIQKSTDITLSWDDSIAYGYFPCDLWLNSREQSHPYDGAYFNKYTKYESELTGRNINQARVDLVKKYVGGSLGVDIGIGCGTFCNSMQWFGYDINPAGVNWLVERNKFLDIYQQSTIDVVVATMFDVFEHIKHLEEILAVLPEWVFISIPVFNSKEAVENSKHFRMSEHFHYFSEQSLRTLFEEHDYECLEINTIENDVGREGISTFVFRKHTTVP